MPEPLPLHRIYVVVEQLPYREIASFETLNEANIYIHTHELTMPVIISRVKL